MLDIAMGAIAAKISVASVITGATKPEQIRANAAASEWRPTQEDMTTLNEILSGGYTSRA
jgi:aryl-alcohol dehydrogenase-like predicted oxidoreductase